MAKTAPCTSPNKRHRWAFLKNVTVRRETGRYVSLTAKGKYKCSVCGATKYGCAQFRQEEQAG